MENFVRIVAGMAIVLLVACGSKDKTPKTSGKATQTGSEKLSVASVLKANGLQGRVVLVEFGTIGCDLSNKGVDAMADWERRKAISGLAFLRLEPVADQQMFDAYYAGKKLPFPVVRDQKMAVASELGTTVYPSFALLDKFGHVRYRGSLPTEKSLAEWVGRLEAEQTDAGPNAPLLGAAAMDIPALLAGTRLPSLTSPSRSLAEYRGAQGLLLTFVDTKCQFSAAAAREVPVVAAALKERGVATVLVNIGDPDAAVKARYGAGIPGAEIVYDAGQQTQRNWNVEFVPTVVLLDGAGQPLYRGPAVWGDVAAALAKKLNLPAGSVNLEATGTNQG